MESQGHDALECSEVFELLSDYLDGSLAPEDCERVRRHIHDCAPCVEFLESLRQSVSLCREYGSIERPAPLSPDVRERLMELYRRATHQE